MFLQVHYLTSYHASLLNRDDAGLAKRIVFGGVPRLRVSSQCQKRHWREWMTQHTELPRGFRTRHFFSRVLKRRLVDEGGMDEQTAHDLIFHLAKGLLTSAGAKDAVDKETLAMNQPVLFGEPEAEYFLSLLKEAAGQPDDKAAKSFLDDRIKEGKANFAALLRQAGLNDPVAGFEGAMFGRFVTSDVLSRVDAPVHVAHAFTTHALDTEVDFFTVVDDLADDQETGAAHANDMELGAGIFYGYVAVDVPGLVSNLTGCARERWREEALEDARHLLNLLIHAIAQVSPGAKLGATAPYARAECVVLEVGDDQPRSLANAYLEPVPLGARRGQPMVRSVDQLAAYLGALEQMYGDQGERRFVASIHSWPREGEQVGSLQQAIDAALDQVLEGRS